MEQIKKGPTSNVINDFQDPGFTIDGEFGVVYDTFVMTENGLQTIEEWSAEDVSPRLPDETGLSFDASHPIEQGHVQTVTITMKSGIKVTVGKDQPVVLVDGQSVPADMVQPGDVLLLGAATSAGTTDTDDLAFIAGLWSATTSDDDNVLDLPRTLAGPEVVEQMINAVIHHKAMEMGSISNPRFSFRTELSGERIGRIVSAPLKVVLAENEVTKGAVPGFVRTGNQDTVDMWFAGRFGGTATSAFSPETNQSRIDLPCHTETEAEVVQLLLVNRGIQTKRLEEVVWAFVDGVQSFPGDVMGSIHLHTTEEVNYTQESGLQFTYAPLIGHENEMFIANGLVLKGLQITMDTTPTAPVIDQQSADDAYMQHVRGTAAEVGDQVFSDIDFQVNKYGAQRVNGFGWLAILTEEFGETAQDYLKKNYDASIAEAKQTIACLSRFITEVERERDGLADTEAQWYERAK
jgi:hypothetical protein